MHYCIMILTINSEEERKIGPLQVKKERCYNAKKHIPKAAMRFISK